MDDKKKIIKDFELKVKNLKKHNHRYYNLDKPLITDGEYDKLKQDLLELQKNFDFLSDLNLVDNIIGSEPTNKFKKIKHLSPMLSLSNAFDKNDMEDFLKKIKNFLNQKDSNIELFSEPKIDGISATLIYENGILVIDDSSLYTDFEYTNKHSHSFRDQVLSHSLSCHPGRVHLVH